MSKHEPMCIHFNENCLKRYTKKYYESDKRFYYSIILLAAETRHNLSDEGKIFLIGLGLKFWLLCVHTDLINS